MKIAEKLCAKKNDMYGAKSVTIAFLGDSVTQGCFECYKIGETGFNTVFDYPSAYSTRFRELLNLLYPNVQVNVINSGISGDSAVNGAKRVERDVLAFNPDLAVVSYGLNDSTGGLENIDKYENALAEIFEKLNQKGVETVFLTQNVMNDYLSPKVEGEALKKYAENVAKNVQNAGVLHAYFESAKKICAKFNVKVCDLHLIWERLKEIGVDTTELLANKINHPIREFHYYMAIKLLETILL